MDVDFQRRAQRVFELALELDADERAALVARECAGDEELGREVMALLAADAAAPDVLSAPVPAGGRSPIDSVKGYRLLGVIGYGGVSTVHLAEPEDRPGARVAVKVLRPSLPADLFAARFAAEQRILSSLAHPFIVPVLGGGTTADGRPYLVMPEIVGEPITEHCDHRQLSLERRIELFLGVCDAVAAAHQDLVVHRDLKPSNVLITDEGEPRLLDFGIAKILDDPGDPTSIEHRILTRNYASPEHLAGRPVSTASDVYSLGVLLHELLCGRRPYEWGDRSVAEIARELAAAAPPRPSGAVDEGTAGVAVADARKATPPGLRRRLRGDLDTIVGKALMADPGHRYRTVDAFAEDLRRHLAGEPIGARPATRLYRLQKLVRRHPLEVGLMATVLVVVASLTAFALSHAQRAGREREAALAARAGAERERSEAVAARAEAEEVTRALLDSFAVADSPHAMKGFVPARGIVDQGAERARELSAFPELQASLRHALGIAYHKLGLYEEAEGMFEQALETRRAQPGAAHPGLDETLLASVAPLLALGRLEEAEARSREVFDDRRRTLGEDHPGTATAAVALASAMNARGAYPAAQELLERALGVHRAAGDDDALATDLELLAQVHVTMGRYPEAASALREAHDLMRRRFGESGRRTVEILHMRAWVQMDQGELDEAAALFRRAIELNSQVLAPDHPFLADHRSGLGQVLRRQGKYEEALAEYRQALAIRRQAFGEEHRDVAITLGSMGTAASAFGQVAQAETWYREALAIFRRVLPPDHPELARALGNLATALNRRGAWSESEELVRQALTIDRAVLGANPGDPGLLGQHLENLAWIRWNRGDPRAAETVYREALEVRQAIVGPDHPDCAPILLHLGWLRLRAQDLVASERLVRQALEIDREGLGDQHPNTAYVRAHLAMVLVHAGRREEARQQAEQALETATGALPDGHWRIGWARVVHGATRALSGESDGYSEAEEGLESVAEAWPPGSLPVIEASDLLALARRPNHGG